MSNPILKEGYTAIIRDNQSAFNVAFKDFYFGPELADLRTEEYTGAAGQNLIVEATDNFQVTSVVFTLFGADGVVLESGPAAMGENDLDWIYTILCVESKNKLCRFVTASRDYWVTGSIRMIMSQLSDERFIQIHRSYIVSLNYIESMSNSEVKIAGKTLPVSRRERYNLYKRLPRFS